MGKMVFRPLGSEFFVSEVIIIIQEGKDPNEKGKGPEGAHHRK